MRQRMRAARGVTAAALVLLLLAYAPVVPVWGEPSDESSPGESPHAAAALVTAELVTLNQIQPTSFKVSHLGSIDGSRARALRHLFDGDSTEARSLAGPELPPAVSAKLNSTLASYCAAAKCGDAQVVSGDPDRFSAEAEREPLLFEFLRRAGFVNLTLTLSGSAPTFEERVDLFFSGAVGAASSILPIEVEYILNLHFGDAPSDRVAVRVFLSGSSGPRPVGFTLVSMPGYRLDSASGLTDRVDRADFPDAGYTTVTGNLVDPGVGATVVLVSGGLPSYCYVIIAGVVGVCLVAMYFGWRRAKTMQRREARLKRQEAKEEAAARGEPGSGAGADGKVGVPPLKPGGAERAKLAILRDDGLITEKEFEARRAEIAAKIKSSRTAHPSKKGK